MSFVIQHQILRFEITVHHPMFVHLTQGHDDTSPVIPGPLLLEASCSRAGRTREEEGGGGWRRRRGEEEDGGVVTLCISITSWYRWVPMTLDGQSR